MQEKSILVVEDDEDLSCAIVAALNKAGYIATKVNTIRDAGFKLKNQAFGCILLDLRVGEEHGEELIEATRSRKDYGNLETPIVVISGYLEREILMTIRPKIQGAIVKPFDEAQMLAMVHKLMTPDTRA